MYAQIPSGRGLEGHITKATSNSRAPLKPPLDHQGQGHGPPSRRFCPVSPGRTQRDSAGIPRASTPNGDRGVPEPADPSGLSRPSDSPRREGGEDEEEEGAE